MKTWFLALSLAGAAALGARAAEPVKNVLKDIPCADGALGRRMLVDEKHLLIMQVALKPGQQAPLHTANSNVHLLVIEGQIVATVAGKDTPAVKGDLLPVAFRSPMSLRNDSTENASLLVLKSPNPSEMKP